MMQPQTASIPNLTRTRIRLVQVMCDRSLHHFIRRFWHTVCHDPFRDNWHIRYLCDELQQVAERVAKREPNPYDLIVNVPPGTSKTSICSIFFPVWCWTRWPWMRFLTFSYNQEISLEPAHASKTVLESPAFRLVYPDIVLKDDRKGVTNFRISCLDPKTGRWRLGGGRLSSSVDSTGTGFHGDINIVDDPLNPKKAASDKELGNTNEFHEKTLPTRKTDKLVTCTILVMQRLHENDPTGFLLNKKGRIRHIRLPGDISDPAYAELVSPPELRERYVDGLLDPVRLSRPVLEALETELGQYGFAAQVGQNPTPPQGGMFKVDRMLVIAQAPPEVSIVRRVRGWDKAGTDPNKEKNREPAYTAGVLMWRLANGKWVVADVVRQRLSAEDREDLIRATAEADGQETEITVEQEPGSGGKESAEATVRNLAGFKASAERPVGNKVARADTLSVQVNHWNVMLLKGEWNHDFIEEFRFFPNSKFKDQVDAASGAFSKLAAKKEVWVGDRNRR